MAAETAAAGMVAAGTVSRRARAKINLALHVVGRREDSYHLLDSLAAFVGVGDVIHATLAEALSLEISGPMAAGLSPGPDNLVLRAAALIGAPARLRLEKHLPLASGIGGGSADAAATLRALAALTGAALPAPGAVLALGADVPVCLAGRPARMEGIGERLTPVALPPAGVVLVNPGVAVSTPEVFRALTRRQNPGLPPIPAFADAVALADWLGATRNDLQAPAEQLRPEIAEVVRAITATEGCLIARMSGSGATCFGLYATPAAAARAAQRLARPGWWLAATALDQGGAAD